MPSLEAIETLVVKIYLGFLSRDHASPCDQKNSIVNSSSS